MYLNLKPIYIKKPFNPFEHFLPVCRIRIQIGHDASSVKIGDRVDLGELQVAIPFVLAVRAAHVSFVHLHAIKPVIGESAGGCTLHLTLCLAGHAVLQVSSTQSACWRNAISCLLLQFWKLTTRVTQVQLSNWNDILIKRFCMLNYLLTCGILKCIW